MLAAFGTGPTMAGPNHNVRPADQARCVADWLYPLLRLGEALPAWALHAVPCLFSGKPRRLAPS
jgi:hypothetical protein